MEHFDFHSVCLVGARDFWVFLFQNEVILSFGRWNPLEWYVFQPNAKLWNSNAIKLIKKKWNIFNVLVNYSVGATIVDETVQQLDAYSAKVGELTSIFNKLINQTLNKSVEGKQSKGKWCSVIVNRCQSYIHQLQNSTKDEALKKHRVAVQVFENELQKLTFEKQSFENFRSKFPTVASEKIAPAKVLNSKFDDYAKDIITRLEESAKKSRKCVIVCWDTALTKEINSAIPTIKEKLEKIHKELLDALKAAKSKTDETINKLENDNYAINDLVLRVYNVQKTIHLMIDYYDEMGEKDVVTLIPTAIEELTKGCRNYQTQ